MLSNKRNRIIKIIKNAIMKTDIVDYQNFFDTTFDRCWYLKVNDDLNPDEIDILKHYTAYGVKEGRQLIPYFDPIYYSKRYKVSLESAYRHFFEEGLSRAYSPCYELDEEIARDLFRQFNKGWFKKFLSNSYLRLPLFQKLSSNQKTYEIYKSGLLNEIWYKEHHEDLAGSKVNSLVHFALFGIAELRQPNSLFDAVWYQNNYSIEDVDMPLIHYLLNWSDGFSPSLEFDNQLYLEAYEDVKKSSMEPLNHYLHYGVHEKRAIFNNVGVRQKDIPYYQEIIASGCFLDEWYANVHEDLRGSGIDPLEHYLLFGEREGRKPNPYFSPAWYQKQYAIQTDKPLLVHFITQGYVNGFDPSDAFSTKNYRVFNKVTDSEINPLAHYLIEGKKQGFKLTQSNEKNRLIKVEKEAELVSDPALRSFIDNKFCTLQPSSTEYYSNKLKLHWVMPDFSVGAGGHMTIFRTIKWLETFGHDCYIWLYNKSHESSEAAYEDIIKHFQHVKAQVSFIDEGFGCIEGDAIFATDWGSVSYVMSKPNFKRRFYFVQDHEPEFYAMGSYKLAASLTYNNDIDCICAGPWLETLMETKYQLWARKFFLAVDTSIYNVRKTPKSNIKGKFKIAFYARHFTSRRAVELGLLALEHLGRQRNDIEVHMFGAPQAFSHAPFQCVDHGILSPKELSDIYNDCDLGIVFSATNYSLIPQEMMACNLPVAEIDTDSTRAVFPEGTVELLSPNPLLMAEQLSQLIDYPDKLIDLKTCALKWVSQFCWEKSAKMVETAIQERLEELDFKKKVFEYIKPKASVIIPTYNGGDVFRQVLDAVMTQEAPWPFEVVVVDSGSKDGTVEYIKKYPEVKFYSIESKDFQHGRTRNFAISKTTGDFVAVLTHDALPAHKNWLFNLVTALEHYPDSAGVFGKHYAWPEADPFTRRDLHDHFSDFDNHPLSLSKDTDSLKWINKDLQWLQFLHFYSDNNSCMRRSVWEKIPYPEVKFGEDQAWAWEIIKGGYSKVYAPNAEVFHSHDFDEGNVEQRAFEEAEFFKEVFGYNMLENNNIKKVANELNTTDNNWAIENDICEDVVERRKLANRAKVDGFYRSQFES